MAIQKYLETQSSNLEFYSAIYNQQGANAAVSMLVEMLK